jgi:hypothetical protein
MSADRLSKAIVLAKRSLPSETSNFIRPQHGLTVADGPCYGWGGDERGYNFSSVSTVLSNSRISNGL